MILSTNYLAVYKAVSSVLQPSHVGRCEVHNQTQPTAGTIGNPIHQPALTRPAGWLEQT